MPDGLCTTEAMANENQAKNEYNADDASNDPFESMSDDDLDNLIFTNPNQMQEDQKEKEGSSQEDERSAVEQPDPIWNWNPMGGQFRGWGAEYMSPP